MPSNSIENYKKSKNAFFVLVSFLLLTLLAFQNCSQTGLEEGEPSSEVDDLSAVTSDASPFAFKVTADHIALMTCPNGNKKKLGEFTFKWGAYRNGLVERPNAGLFLTQEFLDENSNNVDSKKFEALQASAKNSGLQIVSAFYGQGNYKQAQQFNDINNGLINDTARYSVNRYWEQLILNGTQGANYFPNIPLGTAGQRLLEGKLYRASVGGYENPLNDEFSSVIEFSIKNKDLVLGFAHASQLTGKNFPLVSSDGSYNSQTAVGTSYTLSYGRIGHADRYLSSVSQRDLTNNSSGGNGWQCASNMRFKIVQRGDLGKEGVNCNPQPIDPQMLSSQTSTGKRIRSLVNIIDISEWEVDITNQCIVRKRRSPADPCYDRSYYGYTNSDGFVQSYTQLKVDYEENDCINEPYFESDEIAGDRWQEYRICPHYVSICVKQF